jgi:hypothetical protein
MALRNVGSKDASWLKLPQYCAPVTGLHGRVFNLQVLLVTLKGETLSAEQHAVSA